MLGIDPLLVLFGPGVAILPGLTGIGGGSLMTPLLTLVLGTILGLTSVGSGALIGVALIVLFRLTPKRVVGTDVFHAALLLWVAGVAHVISGNVDFGLVGNILIGSIPGVWLGTHFIDRVPPHRLRVLLGAVLLGSALAMIKNAGGNIPIGVIFGVPVAVIVAGFLLQRETEALGDEAAAGLPGAAAVLTPGSATLTPGSATLTAG